MRVEPKILLQKKLYTCFAATLVSLCSQNAAAQAWDGLVIGKVSGIDSRLSVGQLDFRVYIAGGPESWSGGTSGNWAAINVDDPNFKGVQATVMLAYSTDKAVKLYLVRDSDNYCRIGYVGVSG